MSKQTKLEVTEGPIRIGPGRKIRLLGAAAAANDLYRRYTGSGAAIPLGGSLLDLEVTRMVELKTGAKFTFIDDADVPKILLSKTEKFTGGKAPSREVEPKAKPAAAPDPVEPDSVEPEDGSDPQPADGDQGTDDQPDGGS
ncbi:MAG: hypothetical protein Alpg2KO_31560 [Alphaproteobacteria bacterium]